MEATGLREATGNVTAWYGLPGTSMLAIGVLLLTGPVRGQEVFAPPVDPPQVAARRALNSVRVDGVLDEPDWARAEVARGFVQAEPFQGRPASEPTDVRVLFDDEYLYIGAICFDSRGARDLRVRDLRRDFDDTTNDFFGVALDGVRDGRSALVFRVNPLGALRDEQTIDGAPADVEFDAAWQARTTRTDTGWVAEIAIPWSTLRYRDDVTNWGVNFQRVTRRINENSGWSPWPRVVEPSRMDYAGLLTGIESPPPSRNLRALPYLLGEGRHDGTTGSMAADVGGDIKWAVTPNAVVDVTVNPDFGQTDVDRQVVNLSRFSVFFPERRQFFLENNSLFFTGNGRRFEPFFSRRIGLDDEGNPIPITAGGRFSVRTRTGAFGGLAVSQGGPGGASDSQFGVLRYVANFSAQNRLGGLVTVRHDADGRTNTVAGVDGFWRFTPTAFARGTLTTSTTSGQGGEGLGGYVWLANDANWGYVGYVSELVTSGYEAGSGFVLRNDYLRISPALRLDWRPSNRPQWIRRLQPTVILEHFISPSTGAVQEGFVSIRPATIELQNGGLVQYELQPNWQRPSTVFTPISGIDIAPGEYTYLRHLVTVQTDPSAKLALRFDGATGGYFDGSLQMVRSVLQATPDPRFAWSVDYTLNRLVGVGAGAGERTTHLLGTEVRVAADPRVQFVTFIQSNTAADQFTGNARFTWEYRPLAFFTVVYNHRSPMAVSDIAPLRAPTSHRLLVKWSWLLQV